MAAGGSPRSPAPSAGGPSLRLVGLDVGTSAVKAVSVDGQGRVGAQASHPLRLSIPRPGWSEQDPEEWWAAARDCLARVGADRADAIGVTGQMHGAVLLDGRGEVLRPAILWNDQRTSAECQEIEERVPRVRQITGNPMLPGFQLPKVVWLRNHEPRVFGNVRRVMLPKDYVAWRLTGEAGTEPSDASGVGAMDLAAKQWSSEVLQGLGLDPAWFPPIRESSAVAGRTADGVPVVAGAGDQAAAAVGVGAVRPGVASLSLGTSGVAFTATEGPRPDPSGVAHAFAHATGGYHVMGVMLACGGSVRWLRDTLFPGEPYDTVAACAADAPPGCDGLTFVPYLSGERCPRVVDRPMGAWSGLSLAHGRAHLARAVFEGATFGLRECLEAVLAVAGSSVGELRLCGGGARSAFWRQMLADALGTPCFGVPVDEGPAYGAALLAGVGAGRWSNGEAACAEVATPAGRTDPGRADYAEAWERYRRAAATAYFR